MSLAADGEDGNGLQLEKLRLNFSSCPRMFKKIDIDSCGLFSLCELSRGDNLNYQIVAKEGYYYILKAKAPTAKPFAHICSIEESFHILETRSYLTSHMITTEKTLKLKRHMVLDNKISIKSNRTTMCIM